MARWKPKDMEIYGPTRYKAGQVYDGIRRRCINSKRDSYKRYGGRGIKLLVPRKVFIEWYIQQAKGCTDLTVDRIDNNGHYELDNMQLISRIDNIKKAHKEIPESMGCYKTATKIKIGRTVYRSQREASRSIGKEDSYIRSRIQRHNSILPNGTKIIKVLR